VNEGLFVEENDSRDESSRAAPDDAPSPKKFLRFNLFNFYQRWVRMKIGASAPDKVFLKNYASISSMTFPFTSVNLKGLPSNW